MKKLLVLFGLMFVIFACSNDCMNVDVPQKNSNENNQGNSNTEDPGKRPTTLQDVVDNANAGEEIDLSDYELTSYTATVNKTLTIKNGSLSSAKLTVTAENVKLEKLTDLSVTSSSRLTINDSKLSSLLIGGNRETSRSRATESEMSLAMVSVTGCEIEKVQLDGFNSQLNITDTATEIDDIFTSTKTKVILEAGSYKGMKDPVVEDNGELTRIDMTENKTLSILSIYSNPKKAEYEIGEEIDLTGLIVMGTYTASVEIFKSGGWKGEAIESVTKWENQNDYIVKVNENFDTAGVKIVTITSKINSYIECNFHVYVKDSQNGEIQEPDITDVKVKDLEKVKTSYKIGEKLDLSCYQVVGFCNGFEINLSYTSEPANGTTLTDAGEVTITFYYKDENIGTKSISVMEPHKIEFYKGIEENEEVLFTQEVVAGDPLKFPLEPTREGYTFDGWYNGETKVEADDVVKGNLKLTAKWIAYTYIVKFDANGGNGEMESQDFTYDVEQALRVNTFTLPDYNFAGWVVSLDSDTVYKNGGVVKNLTNENKGTVTLYAVWIEKNKVSPVFLSLPSETDVDYGDSVTLECGTEGAKIYYTIDGVTAEYSKAITIIKDVTITAFATKDGMKDSDVSTASYPLKTYTVTYKSDYDTAPSDVAGLKKGDTLTAEQLPELTTDGYTFAGWYNGETKVEAEYRITESLKLTAKWIAYTYTVKFDANGGSGEMESQDFTYDVEQALRENTFTHPECNFAGWGVSPDSNTIYKNGGVVKNLTNENKGTVTLYAVWTEKDRVTSVFFSPLDGMPVDCGDSVALFCGTPGAKIYYTIDGVKKEYTDEIVITDDVTITAYASKDGMRDSDVSTASYSVKTYTVTFTSEHGTVPNSITKLKKYDTFTTENLPKLTATGYTFKGWYDGRTTVKIQYTITCDLEFTAEWTANTYTVKFDANGGSDKPDRQAFTYDVEQALTANTFTRDGYTFAGWNTQLDGKGTSYTDMAKVKNLANEDGKEVTLYAVWTIVPYTITYNLNGGTNASSNPTGYTVEDTITLADATRTDYIFLGWYTDEACTIKKAEITKGITGDITLYAKWWYSVNFVYVQGAIIEGAIKGSGYKDSGIFTDGSTVTVGNFYMCNHEVTQAEYETYCSYGGSKKPNNSSEGNGAGSDHPAYHVSWFDALVYCNKRSMDEGLTPCYTINDSTNPDNWEDIPDSDSHENWDSWRVVDCDFTANGYRLPKEAEWEYAARGGKGLTDPQYKYAGSNTIGDVAWYGGNSEDKTHPIKGKKANGLGLYDMSGNVYEWCWDYYSSDGKRCTRGGSWFFGIEEGWCTVSYRDKNFAYNRFSSDGFRVVRTAELRTAE